MYLALQREGLPWRAAGIDDPTRRHLVIGGAIVGAVQEPLWRAYAFRQLHIHHGWSRWAALLAVSASFGYFHGGFGDPAQPALTFVAALGLSALYARTETIWWPTLLHAAFNVFSGAFA